MRHPKPDAELAAALEASMYCLRMAEKMLTNAGHPAVASYMKFQAEQNQKLLLQTGGF
jgi:hypothetical protein